MGYYATAQILIGGPVETMMDRFTPHYVIYLAENSRPSFSLNATSIHQGDAEDFNQVIWVPTIENTLEDALLMIAIYLHKDQTIVKAAERYIEISNKVECYDIPEEGRKELYGLLNNYEFKDYIIFSIFEGSLLSNQVDRLSDYQVDGEICISNGRIQHS